ncbi:valine--tRNA ligase [Anaerotruncus colihominis]|uniref:Valine--tRNA ligase n=1 Tax=Anaerotruncus colihominis TaxID=169435 RepID=A0A1Y4MWH5_9FIRM|nr:valine--tRNA ligase [Anaerotruncus colihominis]OUP68089.1 valine--tRNA ligase [Anaerotruncus colihominis]OUP72509.1 valine--tRNA ligase [Anaerotruncus colihominis]
MPKQLDKVYDPKQVEDKTYRFWQDGGYFHAEPNPDKKPYTIVIPPPNITGRLHMGHALDETLQDILIRWRRMQGYEALWLPGTDHASIATEAKIVEAMRQEGVTKEQLGREGFLERAWAWKREYGGHILDQLKKLGSSCDWQRERFTLDEGCSRAVREVFVRFFEQGLIYRGERIVNWCPHCLSTISDIEVEYEEKDGFFWHINYPIVGTDDVLEIATTRPETLLGDTAVAVHPDDERYKHLIGKMVLLPIVNKQIPIVADEYVEMDFGTGVVKITPAHDPNDFEVGLRHGLPIVNVMNDDATINGNGGKYQGLTREECRRQIVKDLEDGGFLKAVEPYKHNVGSCYRCGSVIEPRVSKQWFVKMEPLAKPAVEAVRSGRTRFIPERFDKIYFNWMENIKDWCISRQLWWGHRIPAWYCTGCGEMIVSRETPQTCPKCGSHRLEQDPDTLDTWFSSALWPFSTLGWPDDTPELRYFYPTDTLVTGYDIIFFWVARMIFSGLAHMDEVPFKTVLIHGLVRDAQGRKMSKSLGNGIDPLEIIDRYGADALRFTLATGNSPGNDMRFSDEKVNASRNFANKIWNASRFILMNLSDDVEPGLPETLNIEDKWVLSKYRTLVREVTDNLEKFELGLAVQKLYDFIWDILCDWYIELCKSRLQAGGETSEAAQRVLVYVMTGTLKLLHPFMPFITEEIWQALPHDGESIMVAPWPQADAALDFSADESDFEMIMQVIRAIRARRGEMNVPPSKKTRLFIMTAHKAVFEQGRPFFARLAFASDVELGDSFDADGSVQVVTDAARVFIPMDELVDREKELARLGREKAACEKDIAALSSKLDNPGFVAKAPAQVVDGERAKLAKARERLAKIEESIAAFS